MFGKIQVLLCMLKVPSNPIIDASKYFFQQKKNDKFSTIIRELNLILLWPQRMSHSRKDLHTIRKKKRRASTSLETCSLNIQLSSSTRSSNQCRSRNRNQKEERPLLNCFSCFGTSGSKSLQNISITIEAYNHCRVTYNMLLTHNQL